jgi:hypothetical protein
VCESKFGEGKKDRMRECVKVNLERKKKQDERVCESKFGEEKKTG